MFCPKCGQQQVSEEMRFCSRCGLQLGVVTELLASGGSAAGIATGTKSGKRPLANRHARQGAKTMFISGVLLPLAFVFSIIFDSPVPLLLPFLVFMAGLSWMFYFRLFGEETSATPQTDAPARPGERQPTYLPAQHGTPVSDFNNPSHRTAEIVQPPSVTEHTTRLLDDK
jgi:hypothetical protein